MSFETPRGQLPSLTSIRFFAAASIVAFHMLGNWGLPGPQQMGWHFGIGVNLFFILSGFILNYTYRSIDGLGHALRMMGYRIARIWPLHLVTLFGLLVLSPAGLSPDLNGPPQLIATALLVQSWVGDYGYTFAGNSVSWTLSVELFFYLLFPFLVMLRTRYLVLVAVVITALTVAWAQSLWHTTPRGLTFGATTAVAVVRTHPGTFFALFVTGMVAARVFVSRSWSLGKPLATVIEFVSIALAIWFFLDNENLGPQIGSALGATAAFSRWINVAVSAIFFTPLVFVLAIGRGHISQLLSARPLVYLGEISFATYMCHSILILVIAQWPLDQFWGITTYLVSLLMLSSLLYRLVERPANRGLRGVVDGLWRGKVAGQGAA